MVIHWLLRASDGNLTLSIVGNNLDTSKEGNDPWLFIGNFNEIMYSHDKQGGRIRNEKAMEAFRHVLDDCELLDLRYEC